MNHPLARLMTFFRMSEISQEAVVKIFRVGIRGY